MSTATPTPTPAATATASQPGLPSRSAVRWYQLALMILAVALAVVTALAIYFAVRTPTAAGGTSGTTHSSTVSEQVCWQPQVPC